MALLRVFAVGLLGRVSVSLGEPDCSDGECGIDESSLMALRSKSSSGTTCYNMNHDPFPCGAGDTCCGNTCKAPEDKCCLNTENYKFPCHGECCGNACAAPGSKCCKVGDKAEWYPVSMATECRSPTSLEMQVHNSYGTPGGISHGLFQNDFDWTALSQVNAPDCSHVCKGEHDQCYPIKDNGYMGTPCGVLSMGDPQGCFFNDPTQTCALCTTAQSYCCPTSKIMDCKKQP